MHTTSPNVVFGTSCTDIGAFCDRNPRLWQNLVVMGWQFNNRKSDFPFRDQTEKPCPLRTYSVSNSYDVTSDSASLWTGGEYELILK